MPEGKILDFQYPAEGGAAGLTTAGGWVNSSANIIVTIINLLTDTRLEFFSNPNAVSDTVAVTWEPTAIRGRSSRYFGYDHTGPRTTSLELPIHEDYLLGGERNVKVFANKVRALAYPEYWGQVVPPRCYLRVGNTIAGLAIINDVGVAWSRPIRNERYINGSITLSITMLQPMAPSASDIERRDLL